LRSYLRDVFRARLEGDLQALVLSDTAVYWDDEELGYHAPDVAVIFGVRQPRRGWKSFDVAKEKVRPRLIIELVTPRYRKTDVEEKFRDYHQARVRTFVILDRERDESPWTIKAYLWNPDRYVLQPLADDGRFWLEDLNLWIGVDGDNIRCYDGDTDEMIGDYAEVLRARQQLRATADAEKVRAGVEKARADAAEARLRELEAEMARLKGQPPTA
jgi:Uma2 family endonuclease